MLNTATDHDVMAMWGGPHSPSVRRAADEIASRRGRTQQHSPEYDQAGLAISGGGKSPRAGPRPPESVRMEDAAIECSRGRSRSGSADNAQAGFARCCGSKSAIVLRDDAEIDARRGASLTRHVANAQAMFARSCGRNSRGASAAAAVEFRRGMCRHDILATDHAVLDSICGSNADIVVMDADAIAEISGWSCISKQENAQTVLAQCCGPKDAMRGREDADIDAHSGAWWMPNTANDHAVIARPCESKSERMGRDDAAIE